MDKKIKKLQSLGDLLKANAITKEEFEILKKELFIDEDEEKNTRSKLNDLIRQRRVTELQAINNFNNKPNASKSTIKPKTISQNSSISKNDNSGINVFVGIIFLFFFLYGAFNYTRNNDPDKNVMRNMGIPPITNTDNTDNTNTTTVRTEKCSICGNTFTGDGYLEVTDGVWKPCESPYTTTICSARCGLKSTEEFNRAANNLINATSSTCLNCGLGHYQNGFCSQCGAASSERVNQSRSKYADCSLCRGTGIEKPMGANSSGEIGRICPMCDGSGKQSY